MRAVTICHQDALVRESLTNALEFHPELNLNACIADHTLLDEKLLGFTDLLAIGIPEHQPTPSLEHALTISQTSEPPAIAFLTHLADPLLASIAKTHGVAGIINDLEHPEAIVDALLTVEQGQSHIYKPAVGDVTLDQLTTRETLVVRFACEGMSRRELAMELCISEGTAKRLISSILYKTGYDRLGKLAMDLVARGYISPELGAFAYEATQFG